MIKFLFIDFNITSLLMDKRVGIGGATVQALNWIYGLIENGATVGVMVEYLEKYPNDSAIEFYETGSLKYKNPFNWIYPGSKLILGAIYKSKPDYIVQAGAGFILLPLAMLAKLANVSFIHRVANNVDVDNRIYNKISLPAVLSYQLGLKFTSVISCQNDYQYEQLKSKFPKKQIIKLSNPFEILKSEVKPLPLEQRKYVSWVGIFQYQKNLPLLLTIARKLPQLEFRIAGLPKENLEQHLRGVVDELRSLDNVVLEGYVKREDLYPFLAKSICLLNTSLYEGFSNTFLEAFAVGTPVVTTEDIDPDQIIKIHSLGKTCKNFDDLHSCIINLMEDADYMGVTKRCFKYVRKYHNRKMLSKKLLELL
jgi:glycosyltransferase involved in cell wall biosynthesis